MAVEILEIKANIDDIQAKLKTVDRSLKNTGTEAQKSGDEIGESYQSAAQKMGSAETKLKQISATLREQEKITIQFKRELLTLQQQYDQLGNKGSASGFRIKSQMDKLNAAIKDQTQSVRALKSEQSNQKGVISGLKSQQTGVTSLIGGFQKLAGVIGAAYSVRQALTFLKTTVDIADKAKGVSAAFNDINGVSLDELRASTQGLVNDLSLMTASVQADKLGVPVKRLGELFQFAQIRARETGQSVDFLVNSIIVGLGRKSRLVLDNLGIGADQLKAALGGVGLESASTVELTNALADSFQGDLAKGINNSISSAAQLGVTYDNISLKIGNALLPAYEETNQILNLVLKSLFNISDANDAAWDTSEITEYQKSLNALTAQSLINAGAALKGVSNYEDFSLEMAGLALVTAESTILLSENADELNAFLEKQTAEFSMAGNASKTYAAFLDQVRARLKLLAAETGGSQLGILESLKEQVKSFDEQIISATSVGEIYTLNAQRIRVINQIKAIEKVLSDQELRNQVNINAQLRIRKGLREVAVDAPLEGETNFANDPFEAFTSNLEPAQARTEEFYARLEELQNQAFEHERDRQNAINQLYADDITLRISDAERYRQSSEEQIDALYEFELEAMQTSTDSKNAMALAATEYQLELERQMQQAQGDLLMAGFDLAMTFGAKNAEQAKALASFQAILSAFVAINATMANPQLLFPANLIAATAIGVQAFANVARIQSESVPSFYKGTDFLVLNGNPKGKDTIPIWAHEGEAIIPTYQNAQYPGLASAWISGDLDRYLSVEHVIPALKAQKQLQDREQNEVMATAIRGVVKAELKDDRIVNRLQHLIYANEEIAEAMKRKRRNPYRAN